MTDITDRYIWKKGLFKSTKRAVYKRNVVRNNPFVLNAAKSGLLRRFQLSLFYNAHCNVIVFTSKLSLEVQSPEKSHSSKCKIHTLKTMGKVIHLAKTVLFFDMFQNKF